MITVSDNTATNTLIRRLGMDRIDALRVGSVCGALCGGVSGRGEREHTHA